MPHPSLTCLSFLEKVKSLQLTCKTLHDLNPPFLSSALLMPFPCTTCSNSTELLVVPQMYQGPYYQALHNALFQLANSSLFFVLKIQFRHNLLCKDFTELTRLRTLSSVQSLYPENNLNIVGHFLVWLSH